MHLYQFHNLQLLSVSANWRSTLYRCHTWFVSRHCTGNFMDWLNGTVHIPDIKTGLWLRNFPYTLSEIFLLNSSITFCHTLLYPTRCLTDQEQDVKFAAVMTRVTAYNFHVIFILYILFSSLYLNCLFQLHWFCTRGWQSVTINWIKI